MNLMKNTFYYIILYWIALILLSCKKDSMAKPQQKLKDSTSRVIELVSGKPLKIGTEDGVGRFSLTSIAVYNMGLADVNKDGNPDIFLCSDHWHPGSFLYLFKGFTKNNEPIFSEPIKISLPFEDNGRNKLRIHQAKDGSILGFWFSGNTLKFAEFNATDYSFGVVKSIQVENLPRNPWLGYLGIHQKESTGEYVFFFGIREDGVFDGPMRGQDATTYTAEGFWPYELPMLGIYAGMINNLNQTVIDTYPLTGLDQTYYALQSFDVYDSGKEKYVIAGTLLGNLYAYPFLESSTPIKIEAKRYIVDSYGDMHRNPAMHSFGSYFKAGDKEGIITTSEGGIFYYENKKIIDSKGNLVFNDPVHVMQVNADIYGGSLVVPELVDWDGDGKLDLISGTSTGEIYFFKNKGTNINPSFQNPEALKAGGKVIKIQGGYRESIQGPIESRWGYTSPTVIDWNDDGLPDILMGDVRGKFTVYLNNGTKDSPSLSTERSLYIYGMDMHGAWRVKPGIAKVGDKMMYICLDKDDELHLYWKVDSYNLEDGGKLKLTTGEVIESNYEIAGAVGRSKITITDWDGDGVLDLLIGVPKWASIPKKNNGLPYFLPKSGATVVFLRNDGTNEEPVYEYPKILKYNGENILLGGHECGPTVGELGGGPALIVGVEQGQFIYYDKKALSW